LHEVYSCEEVENPEHLIEFVDLVVLEVLGDFLIEYLQRNRVEEGTGLFHVHKFPQACEEFPEAIKELVRSHFFKIVTIVNCLVVSFFERFRLTARLKFCPKFTYFSLINNFPENEKLT